MGRAFASEHAMRSAGQPLGMLSSAPPDADDALAQQKSKKVKEKAGEGKDGEEKPQKKKWSEMTKADWDKLEREADQEGEEPFEMPKAPDVKFDPSNPAAYMKVSPFCLVSFFDANLSS